MSQTCNRCGATLKKNAKFCTVCGTSTTLREKGVTPTQLAKSLHKCPNCGKALKESAKFCTACGTNVAKSISTPVIIEKGTTCSYCGWSKNPESSNFCINCGQELSSTAPPSDHTPAEAARLDDTPTRLTCNSCGNEAKVGSKFCIYCGGSLSPRIDATETTVAKAPLSQIPEEAVESPVPSEVISTQPLAIPADVLASLMARGRQLTIEEEYAKNGTESDELFEELSQAAGESDFELEELIDNFINERAELERLDDLYEKEEVSGRVYERLKAEYDDKLRKMDEQIQAGVIHLKGYQVQIQLDLDNAKEELDTIEARILIGDEEDSDKKQKSKLTEKTKRLEYALLATQHILQKESTMRNGPLSRFEVTETTLADSQLAPSVSEDPEELKESEESDKTERTSPEPKSTTPSPDRSASQPEAEAGKICNQCGRVTASEAQFCIHCGSPL